MHRQIILGLCSLLLSTISVASDHVDGEISINNPVADITDLYAFPSPTAPGNLVLILNSYPFVGPKGHFSDRLTYSLLVRPLRVNAAGVNTSLRTVNKAYRFDCTFETPHGNESHKITCRLPSGETITNSVDNSSRSTENGVKVFAGRRADPFLFSSDWFGKIVFDYCIPPADASNDIKDLSILSIVLELDPKLFFNEEDGNLFAVAGEISQRDGEQKIIDRVGRPELSNGRLVTPIGKQDLREWYNQENVFQLDPENASLYQQRLAENLTYFDSLDQAQDWPDIWGQTLTQLLLNDYLIIDINKSFSPQAYFDIENSLLRNQPNTRSGGRVPGERIINALMTTMVNGGHGAAVVDGIGAEALASQSFPYLAEPGKGFMAWIKRKLAPRLVAKLSLKQREDGELRQCD